jgi:hypothetical protein
MKIMERIYRAKNGVVERTRFYVGENAQPRTGKKNASTPRKQEANKNRAAHVLGRILNHNFEQGDLNIELSYDNKSFRALRSAAYATLEKGSRAKKEEKRDALWAAAKKDGEQFIRRLRKAGAEDLRYVLVPSDMDGTTGEEVRVHLHLVISGDAFVLERKELRLRGNGQHRKGKALAGKTDSSTPLRCAQNDGGDGVTLEELWGKGIVLHEFLRGGSYNKLAAYLIRQTREIKNRKKYTCSRNLEQIEPEEWITTLSPSEDFPTPKGYRREEWQGGDADRRAMQYARYVPEPNNQDRKPGRKARKRE